MKLHIRFGSLDAFDLLYKRSELLRKYLSKDRAYIAVWYLNVGANLTEITHILDENKIKYRFESD